jgi:hypothetical protein
MRNCNLKYAYCYFLSLSACMWACQPISALAGDPASTLAVDASQTVTQSDGGDDLATLKNIFQDANAPQDGATGGASDPRRTIISDLKMKRMRILQGDAYCDIDANGTFGNRPLPDTNGNYPAVVPGDCDLMKWQIDWALLSGLSPHVAVGATLPVSFALNYGPAETWANQHLANNQTPLDLYKSYAKQLIRYIANRAFAGGAPSVTVEVSNELDIAESAPLNFNLNNPDRSGWSLLQLGPWGRFLWWIDPASYQLTQWPGNDASPQTNATWYPYGSDFRRVDRGIAPMQKIFADAVQSLKDDADFQAQYPGKTLQLAGPALAGGSYQWINFWAPTVRYTLEEWFLDEMLDSTVVDPSSGKVAPYNIPALDHFSFHYYGDFRNGNTSVTSSAAARQTTTLKYETDRIRAKLTALGHSETKLFVSEWGPTVDPNSDINYSHKGAAWVAAFLTEAVADRIAMGSYLVIDDAVGATVPGSLSLASLLYKDGSGNYLPKAPANALKMFAMMTGTRRAVTLPTGTANLGAFAASDSNSASVLVFNYPYDYSFTDTPQTFSVELDNLPFNGLVTVERYLIDRDHSNLGKPGTDPSLQLMETTSNLQVIGGQVTLPCTVQPCALGLGVTLFRVTQN